MEKAISCATAENSKIKELATILGKLGMDGCENYYEADEYSVPYFKLPKKFKKETDNDPDDCFVYVDVGDEYTVHGRYLHEHLQTAQQAARLAYELWTGAIVEVVLVFPDRMAGFFLPNLGAPEKHIKVIDDNVEYIMEQLNSPMASSMNFHGHLLFSASSPYFLQVGASRQPQIEGVTVYAISSVFAEHPEYYVIR